MCSSVSGCWLGFACAGLSSLIALALLGALIMTPLRLTVMESQLDSASWAYVISKVPTFFLNIISK